MLSRKNVPVVGLTTFNNELLKISIPALGKLRQKFLLIIYNDNPATTLTRRQIHRMGYCGEVQIINTSENVGTLRARLAILDAVAKLRPAPDWILFADDDDMVVNLDIPNVAADNFAVIQNSVVLRHRVADLMRVMENPADYVPDDENVILMRPHIGFAGTLIRASMAISMAAAITPILDKVQKIDDSLDYRPPVDAMMWSYLNICARNTNPNATPIYMDKVNYISIKLDSAVIKYGRAAVPARSPADHYARAIARYNAALDAALRTAAPQGQK